MYNLHFKWSVSRARNSYGYNICTLLVNNKKAARCNGGGYDMQGTVLGNWIAREFEKELLKLKIPMNRRNNQDIQEYYGLTYHDPNYDPSSKEIEGKTISQREKEGLSLGLERYQSFYSASSHVPTKRHIIPLIDGACGMSSVEKILNGLGYVFEWVNYKLGIAQVKEA